MQILEFLARKPCRPRRGELERFDATNRRTTGFVHWRSTRLDPSSLHESTESTRGTWPPPRSAHRDYPGASGGEGPNGTTRGPCKEGRPPRQFHFCVDSSRSRSFTGNVGTWVESVDRSVRFKSQQMGQSRVGQEEWKV